MKSRTNIHHVSAHSRISVQGHRRRSGWTSGGTHGERRRWVRVEWGAIWRGVSFLQPTKGSGGASRAPPVGSGAEPRPKTDFGVFWRTQNAHFCTYMTKSGGETICISVPRSKFWGDLSPLSPHDLRPCSRSEAKVKVAVRLEKFCTCCDSSTVCRDFNETWYKYSLCGVEVADKVKVRGQRSRTQRGQMHLSIAEGQWSS